MHLLERRPDGAQLRAVDGLLVGEPVERFSVTQTVFAADGQLLACILDDAVHIYDTSSKCVVQRFPIPGAVAVHFSPASSYLVIYQKAKPSGAGDEKNLTVWLLGSGKMLFACFQKTFSKSVWPTLQFSADESIASRVVTNEVHIYHLDNSVTRLFRLRVPRVSTHKISPGKPFFVAFIPETKGQPGSVRLYDVPSGTNGGVSETEPLAHKSFFRVQEVVYEWAANGSAVLILGSSEIDATNQSYYGESTLMFMRTDRTLQCKVRCPNFPVIHLFLLCGGKRAFSFNPHSYPLRFLLTKKGQCTMQLSHQELMNLWLYTGICLLMQRFSLLSNANQSIS
jgi:translation initiation factor 2A